MQIIKRIVDWQKERNLHLQEFSSINESANIIEEVLELNGYKVPRENRDKLKIEINRFIEDLSRQRIIEVDDGSDDSKEIDALADIVVFAIGGMLKLKYFPQCVMDECLKEIESRTGTIIDGKFQKDTSPETVKKWYKAQYEKCKEREQ
jgi:hypothetical protein